MQRFFSSNDAIFKALNSLSSLACPRCGAVGCFNRHGTIQGFVSNKLRGTRAWRIHCRPRKGGCGHTPSLRLESVLARRCLDARSAWLFLKSLLGGASVQAAWDLAHTGLSVDCAYRLLRCISHNTSSLRTLLLARAPPPGKEAGLEKSLLQTLHHLKNVFGEGNAICAFQRQTQTGFP